MHDIIGFGLVLLAILAGILLNNRGLDKLDAKVDKLKEELSARIDKVHAELSTRIDKINAELSARLDRMQADLSQFYSTTGRHEARLDNIEKRIN